MQPNPNYVHIFILSCFALITATPALFSRVDFAPTELTALNYVRSRFFLADMNRVSAAAPVPAEAPFMAAVADHDDPANHKNLGGWIVWFAVGIVAGLIGIAAAIACSLLVKKILALLCCKNEQSGPRIFSLLIKKSDLDFLSDVNCLESLQVIGRGGCGEVYKVITPGRNGRILAVKKITQPLTNNHNHDLTEEDSKLVNRKMRQIRSEIRTMGHIRHTNLLSLLAHVPRPNSHLLVYEYMKNGSLEDVLNDVSRGSKELEWAARHKIALGVASGLEYLHHNLRPRVIHRDLKPGNILLDDHMEARISDFGLAKLTHCDHFTTSNVVGTVGYIAPEYHQTLHFTDKCDIYSFGVLLGALVMGKLPSDVFFQSTEEMSLVKWMRNVMVSEDSRRAIDPKLMGNGFEEQMILALKVACFCTLDNPTERPNSKDLRCMLAQIKH